MTAFRKYLFILILLPVSAAGHAQVPLKQVPDSVLLEQITVLPSVDLHGKLVPHQTIQEVFIIPEKRFPNRRQFRRYTRLMYHVRKVYPYAVLAGEKMNEMEQELQKMETEKEKKAYIDRMERELFSEFEDDLKKMTITQGRILIKLVDRETGDTSYDLIRELKGSFSAFFWQSIARIFGSNLKAEYDPHGEDADIEEIVRLIEMGYI
ncbi:MAG TPA: DUF4294 domain-containing protein [Bacteroidetes bacterium]|nr:DUF4294 domain-containing protein [Bacteroidota bacterium]